MRAGRSKRWKWMGVIVAVGSLVAAPPAAAQDEGAAEPPAEAEPLAPGMPAPDFALVGASAEGILPDSIRPTDFRGHTLVIAFFFRARSSG